jgi:DNA-binding HxlR family transcriptional regulator
MKLATLQGGLAKCKSRLARRQHLVQNGNRVGKSYSQYCPVAHALDLVGERWSLLIARELLHGPRRYTDLAEALPGIGTNILASRLRELEASGVVAKRRLPPPTPVTVYELTETGRGLHRVLHELARWGARSLGPPPAGEAAAHPGWLEEALRMAICLVAPPGRYAFRIGDERASIVDGEAVAGEVDAPDVIVTADQLGFYHLFVDGRTEGVEVEGDRAAFERLLAATVIGGAAEPVAA